MSDSLRPHGLQHARLPCSSPSPRACSNSTSIESVLPSSHLILCRPLLLLPSIFSSIRVFSSESTLRIGWPKYWCFSFSISISPSSEYPGLISFRMDWIDLCSPRDSQVFSNTTVQCLNCINSLSAPLASRWLWTTVGFGARRASEGVWSWGCLSPSSLCPPVSTDSRWAPLGGTPLSTSCTCPHLVSRSLR